MAWHAASRLTLTKSKANPQPVVEKDEPFPESGLYSDADMKRMEEEGWVYWKGRKAAEPEEQKADKKAAPAA